MKFDYDVTKLSLELESAGFQLNQSKLGRAKLSDLAASYADVKDDFSSIQFSRAVKVEKGALFRPEGGRLTLTTRSQTYQRAMFGKRIRLKYDGVTLFTGVVTHTTVTADPVNWDEPIYRLIIDATDKVDELVNSILPAFTAPNELGGARAARAYSTVDLTDFVDDDYWGMPAQTGTENRTVMDVLQDVADNAQARFYVKGDGAVVIRDRVNPSATPAAYFSDAESVRPQRKNYAYNGDWVGNSFARTVIRTNLVLNPLALNNTTNWNASGGTGGTAAITQRTAQTGWAMSVTTSARATWSVASTAPNGGLYYGNTASTVMGVTVGRTYTAFIQGRCSKTQRLAAQINWYDNAGATLASTVGTHQVLAANTVGNFTVSGTAPTNAVRAIVTLYAQAGTSAANWAVGDWLEATWAHFEANNVTLVPNTAPTTEANTLTSIFHGGQAASVWPGPNGNDYAFAFTGTAHASTSTATLVTPYSDALYSGAVGGRVMVYGSFDIYSLKVIPTTTSNDSYAEIKNQTTSSGEMKGKTWTVSSVISLESAQVGTLDARARRIVAYYQSPTVAGGVMQSVQSSQLPNTALASQRLSLTVTVPSDATYFSLRLYNGSNNGADAVYWDDTLIEEGTTVRSFFTGRTHEFSDWSGLTAQSVSTYGPVDSYAHIELEETPANSVTTVIAKNRTDGYQATNSVSGAGFSHVEEVELDLVPGFGDEDFWAFIFPVWGQPEFEPYRMTLPFTDVVKSLELLSVIKIGLDGVMHYCAVTGINMNITPEGWTTDLDLVPSRLVENT